MSLLRVRYFEDKMAIATETKTKEIDKENQ